MILQRKGKNEKKKGSSTLEWQLSLQANPKSFNFYFKATNNLFLPFNFALRVSNSDPHPSLNAVVNKSKSANAKLLGIFRKFRFCGTKKEAASAAANGITVDFALPPAHFWANWLKFDAYKEPKCVGSIIIGFIGLLSHSISQNDQNRIILYSLIILLFLLVTFVVAIVHLSSKLKNRENNILDQFGHY